jgi:hypothetical protein
LNKNENPINKNYILHFQSIRPHKKTHEICTNLI